MYVIKNSDNLYWTGDGFSLSQREALRFSDDDKAKLGWLVSPPSSFRFVKIRPRV